MTVLSNMEIRNLIRSLELKLFKYMPMLGTKENDQFSIDLDDDWFSIAKAINKQLGDKE